MQIDKVLTLTLDLPARPSFLHVATEFAGTSAAAYGLGKDECLKLGLAVEEIFMHLCKTIGPEQFLEIRSLNGVICPHSVRLFRRSVQSWGVEYRL